MNKLCIYCLRDENEINFSREHIIPSNIGGKLFIDDFVCSDCNSDIGSKIDILVFGLPEILEALDKFSIPYNRSAIYRKLYKVRATSGEQILRARATQTGFEVVNQELQDGSMIISDFEFHDGFKKSIKRDSLLNQSELTNEDIRNEVQRVIYAHNDAEVGDLIESKILGRVLIKRSDKIKFQTKPRIAINMERFVSKITFEFLFFIGAHNASAIINFLEPLFLLINTGEKQDPVFITRQKPLYDESQPFHAICLESAYQITRVEIILFGTVTYLLIGPALPNNFFDQYSEQFDCNDVCGIIFEQELHNSKKKFALIRKTGDLIKLA